MAQDETYSLTVRATSSTAYSFVAYDEHGHVITSPTPPSTDELFARAADEQAPLAVRMFAAEEAARQLRSRLESECLAVFPDFYWSSSERDHPFGMEGASVVCRVPQARKMCFDAELTPERDIALRELGFTHFGGLCLGMTSKTVDVCDETGEREAVR